MGSSEVKAIRQQSPSTSRAILLRHYINARWRFTKLQGNALNRYQNRMAGETIRYAVAHSSYYAAHFNGFRADQWRTLPTTDKRLMMANFTDLNTRAVSLDRAMETALRAERDRDFSTLVPGTDLTVGLSSGTSGHRGLFMVNPEERASWAGTLLARALPGPLLRRGGWRIAFFHRSGSNLYQSLSSRAIAFRFFDLMTPLKEAVAQLNEFEPHLLVAPPTMLDLLARERRDGRLNIHPEKVISVAEVLEPQDAALIAESFDVPHTGQIYQCTEGLLAVTCREGALHLQEDIVAVQSEPLDPDESPNRDREHRMTPVITDLWRRVQPIIRYQLGDVLVFPSGASPACPCGSRFRRVSRIEGRCDDVLHFPRVHSKELRPFFPDTLRRAVLLADSGIIDYRVVQERLAFLRVYLLLLPGTDTDSVVAMVKTSILRTVNSYGCSIDCLSVEQGLPDEPLERKRRRVRRL